MNTEERTALVQRMHKTPHKVAMAITGGGAEVIGELLRHGNGSATLLEAVVPYDQAAFTQYIRGVPDKFCSPEAARDLAMAAFLRAIEFERHAPVGKENLIGLGASCSLAKPDGERTGREHRAYIAVQTAMATTTFNFDLLNSWKLGPEGQQREMTREQEESFVADRILEIIAETMGLGSSEYINNSWMTCIQSQPKLLDLLTGKEKYIALESGAAWRREAPQRRVIFSGSFFPIHQGHLNIAKKASELTNSLVDFEVCIHNVDKPSLNFQSFQERLETMRNSLKGTSCAEILFTSTPKFVEKAEIFPNSTFVVGWDTFRRIADAKYYGEEGLKNVLTRFRQLNTKFLVFHRIINGKSSACDSLSCIPGELIAMSTICGEDVFTPSNYSSSAIRKEALFLRK